MRTLRAGHARLLLLALCSVILWTSRASAQRRPGRWEAPIWVGHATFLGSNALIGGVTAGLMQELRGGDFTDGFARGALGGAVAYAGRRVSVERFDGAGFLGRQVSAVGVSMVRNAGEGRGALERLFFPIGPLHLYVDRSDGIRVRPKVHLYTLGWTTVAAIQDETVFDWSASLSAGAPVFWAPRRQVMSRGEPVRGIAAGGNIILSDLLEFQRSITFAHERVHVLQQDFMFYAWSDPVDERLAERTGLTRILHRYLDFGVTIAAARALLSTFVDLEYRDRPQEIEASFLHDRGGER